MSMTTRTQANVTNNVHLSLDLLEHAEPHIVFDRFAQMIDMPQNKRETIYLPRPIVYSAVEVPTQEGITPSATQFDYEYESATLAQYAQHTVVTDWAADTGETQVMKDAKMMLGENIGRSRESWIYGVVKAGTTVQYANGASRAAVNSTVTLNGLRNVKRTLEANKAKPVTKVMKPGPSYNTTGISPAFIGICHTDVEADLRGLPGFTPMEEYASQNLVHPREIGKVEGIRFVTSADASPWEDAGGTASTNGTKSTTGTSSDVYPIIVFGANAFACVNLKGYGAIEPTVIPASTKTKDDPHGQRGYIGWKTYWAGLITNDDWVVRYEVAVDDLS